LYKDKENIMVLEGVVSRKKQIISPLPKSCKNKPLGLNFMTLYKDKARTVLALKF